MPKRPARKGIAPEDSSYLGFRDKVGVTFRSGPNAWVLISYDAWGGLPAGEIPARLYRFFGWEKDRLAAYRLDVSTTYTLNYAMLAELGSYVLEKVPADIQAAMAIDPKKVVETNWAVSDAFEIILGDAEMVRPGGVKTAGDSQAYEHVGTLILALTPTGDLRKHGGVNYATGFKAWTEQTMMSEMVPENLKKNLPKEIGIVPCSADAYNESTHKPLARMPVRVAAGGGPTLDDGEEIYAGADELVVSGVEYINTVAATDALAGFETAFAYITSNPYDDPLVGIEMLDHPRLRALATCPTTRALLDQPVLEKRLYLNGSKELVPGWRTVTIARSAIRRAIIAVAPALLEGVTLLRGAGDVFTFECAARSSGALVPLRRCSESLARARLARLLQPSPRAVGGLARAWLQDLVPKKVEAAKGSMDPLEFTVPCPYSFVVSFTFFAAMRRSSEKRHVISYILEGVEDADAFLGFLGWHAPQGKEINGFYLIVTPTPPVEVAHGATINPRRVKGLSRHEYNYVSYDTETQELTVRLSVARFNASKRVRGASVGTPPADPPPGGGTWKYSLLDRAWVPASHHAPTVAQLKARYPAGPAWMFW